MSFVTPAYLWLLPLAPLLLLLAGYGFRRKRQSLAAFATDAAAGRLHAQIGSPRQWLAALLVALACGLLVLALMQPQWGTDDSAVGRRGRDVLIVLDVSLSMMAEDAAPNRLEAAKTGIRALVEQVRAEGGHRLGLIAFAGRATMLSPLTLDYPFFLQKLTAARTESVMREGSLLGDALRKTLQGFGELNFDYTDVILLSDGEDHDSVPREAARIAKAQNVTLHTVGIGDYREGAVIPLKNDDGTSGVVQFEDQDVVSRMRQDLLSELAQTGGGVYVPAATGPVSLTGLFTDHIKSKDYRSLDDAGQERAAHRFQWFLLPAILLLVLELAIRRRQAGNNS